MKRSTERILTTHAGSLARPPDLLEMMRVKESDQPYDHEAFAGRVRTAVAEVVRKQLYSTRLSIRLFSWTFWRLSAGPQ